MNRNIKIGIVGLILAFIPWLFNKNYYYYYYSQPYYPEICIPEEPIRMENLKNFKRKLSFRWQKSLACDKLGLKGTATMKFSDGIDLMTPSGKIMQIGITGYSSGLFHLTSQKVFCVTFEDDDQGCYLDIETSLFRGYLINFIGDLFRRISEPLPIREDVEIPAKNMPAIKCAAKYGYAEECKFLKAGVRDADKIGWYGGTHLHHAASACSLEICKALIEEGAAVNNEDSQGDTPLHRAVKHGNTEICKLLIQKGAYIESKNREKQTPLMGAIWYNRDIETYKVLIAAGADIHTRDKDGRTPLHIAALNRRYKLCELLIEKGADINAKDIDGETPLIKAARGESAIISKLLVENGADVNGKDSFGRTWSEIAVSYELNEVRY